MLTLVKCRNILKLEANEEVIQYILVQKELELDKLRSSVQKCVMF
jgi:hypothetical protein